MVDAEKRWAVGGLNRCVEMPDTDQPRALDPGVRGVESDCVRDCSDAAE